MAAAALPIALLLGLLAELVSGLVGWAIRRDRPWWRGVSGLGTDAMRLLRDREGRERVSVAAAGGAAASMLGAGIAAAGGLDLGPGDLPLLYLALGVASVGAWVTSLDGRSGPAGERNAGRLLAALAEPAFAVALGAMFLRYGALDLDAVRGTQRVLGTGLLLAPELAAAGLACAALAFVAGGSMRLLPSPDADRRGSDRAGGAGTRLVARLARWSVAGATALVAGPLLAGGGLDPLTVESILPAGLAALGVSVAIGSAHALLSRLGGPWRLTAPGIALALAAAGAAMVVLA